MTTTLKQCNTGVKNYITEKYESLNDQRLKTDIRKIIKAKMVWKKYRTINLKQLEKTYRSRKLSTRQMCNYD